MIPKLLKAGKPKILASTAALVALTTLVDWASGNNISLAALYILPMMLGAVVLGPLEIAALAVLCSYLRYWFDVPGSPADLALRFVFAALAYFLSGLFVAGLVRKHEQAIRHLNQIQVEQTLRQDAEEQLRVLAESSPAGIFTVDGAGKVLAANTSANRLFMLPLDKTVQGRLISDYLPFLGEVLRLKKESVGLRTATQCQGFRENGEIFLAHIWFSSYSVSEGKRLAAIVVDSSDEMRDREEQGLRQLQAGNEIAAVAIAHEVRNVCEAMAMLCDDLRRRHGLARDESLSGLEKLVSGLEAIAYLELQPKTQELVEEVPLKEVLDNLRIIVEPAWREIEGTVRWHVPDDAPAVWAEPHGLLQVFLNLAQNSHRAVQEGGDRTLDITICSHERKVSVKFHDSGPGIRTPENLFQPFQKGAAGSGLGLYLSRSIVRNYGGELRFESVPRGSCFIIELEAV
ncbi:MAG: putative sensory box sensor histidine kinase/response regulator [Bryobacterales bacterium]|nr:putative sensory box sensor histidine kinase/response regulator [Bryobacterales bacterium]